MEITTLNANKTLNFYSLLLGLAALLFIITPLVSAAGLSEVGVLSNGPSFDMVETNGYLYVAQGSEVRVYDISNRAAIPAMTFKSSLAELPVGGPVHTVTIQGQYLYIAAENKFVIADISRPTLPIIVSSLDNPVAGSKIYDVVVKGNYAYLMIAVGGVQVVDISNPASPVFLTRVKLAGANRPWRATIDGNYLYVGLANNNRMDIFDISDQTNPRMISSFTVPSPGLNHTSSIAVKNGYAYMVQYYNGVRVIDVTNPSSPVEVTPILKISGANDIQILGDKAYISARYQGFDIVDISNPRAIAIVGKTTVKDGGYYNEGIYAIPGYTFLAMESIGFGIYDTATASAPRLLVRVPVMGGADSLTARDNILYIGAHNEGIWTVDVTKPTAPKELAMASNLGRNRDISLQDNLLYAAGEWSKLSVIDVSSPSNPILVNQQIGKNIGTVLADGKYVYTELGIVDFSNPSAPSYVVQSPYFFGKFARYGDKYLLVAASEGTNKGLHILDISDKKNPVHMATFNSGTPITDIVVNGNVATALSGSSLITVDISNISSPVEFNRVSYLGHWTGAALDANNTIVYAVGSGENQVRAFDISDPTRITLVDSLQLYGDFDSVDYDKGYVYAGQKFGVYIISTSIIPPANHPPVLDPVGNKLVNAGSSLNFAVNAMDPDGDLLKFSAGPMPVNASFNDSTKTFAWIPMVNQSGITNVTFVVSDGKLMDTETISVTVTTTNHPPVLDPVGNKLVSAGSSLNFAVNATDPDGDLLKFSAGPMPVNASFNASTKTFAWIPMVNQSGITNITFVVSDGKLMDTENISVTVTTTNHPPVLDPVGNKLVSAGSSLNFAVNATDPDGDLLKFSAGPMPVNASFNASTKTFAWIPMVNQSGITNITFVVSDGKLMDTENISVTVTTTNHPPVLDSVGNKLVSAGSSLNFAVNATDPDGDLLKFSAGPMPVNASFNASTKTFAWIPMVNQSGITNITFVVSDGKLMDTENISVTVKKINHAPVLNVIGDKVVNEGESLIFVINANDADNDILIFSSSTLPYNATLDKTTGRFTWVTTFTSAGKARIKFSVSDGLAFDSKTINITVNNVNRAPYFVGLTNKTVYEGIPLTFKIAATDPDPGDTQNLRYRGVLLPDGAQFNSTSRTVSWTPTYVQAGVYQIRFAVSDGSLENTGSLWVNVMDVNHDPQPNRTISPQVNNGNQNRAYILLS